MTQLPSQPHAVGPSPPDDARLDETYRDHWGRLLALLVAQYRRLDLAEDALADAFESATRHWPHDGVPVNPPAWLLTAARRRAIDRLRSEAVAARKEPLLVVDARLQESAQRTMADPGHMLVDERLRLILLCAHPSLDPSAASALTLRLVLGVPTRDIARLFLVTEPAMAARITRARKKIVVSGVPFAVPAPDELPARLELVAQVIYLGFTAGYAPGSGPDLIRTDLAGEAVRLGRLLLELLPGEPLVAALTALMLLQHSRRDARIGDDGMLVLLPDQDRTRWHHDEIAEALDILTPLVAAEPGHSGWATTYLLQALIAAEHAVAPTSPDTSWERIAQLYAELEAHTDAPVVRLNRAVAVAEIDGPQAGLDLLVGLDDRLAGNHRLPATRAELLVRLGDPTAASRAFEQAIAWCGNEVERQHLHTRLDEAATSAAG